MREAFRRPEPEPNNRSEPFAVLAPAQFLRDFQNEATFAFQAYPLTRQNVDFRYQDRPRIGVGAMWVEFFGAETRAFYDVLQEANQRGFVTGIHRDGFSKMNRDEELVMVPPTRFAGKDSRHKRHIVAGFSERRLQMLKDNGSDVLEVNPVDNPVKTATFLFKDRDHRKFYFVKTPHRSVAWIGGMNLAREHFKMFDFMVKVTDSDIVGKLIEEFDRVGEKRRMQSEEIPCTDDTSILADTGKDESITVQKVVELNNRAQSTIYTVSALHPAGAMLASINKAQQRGVHVVYITVDPKIGGLWGLQSRGSDMVAGLRRRKIPLVYLDMPVHGKVHIVDPDIEGKGDVIVGSHNFVDQPHEEMSLYSRNPVLVRNLVQFLENTIGTDNLRKELTKDTVVPVLRT